ncbi:uncharacterized protein PAC_13074 [Phialocephala subalpina]|uniref:Uncharacterized protein n=1 Tax=Phialocephala subalpina TaxID=576137 RepID=A0A1L7XDX9_9HELO|nr:uncharacterized protein PAC_13074 [Phialocephala subalpina]
MASLWLLALLITVPLVLFIAWLAVSSCLGDNFRARVSGMSINPRHALFDRNYLRTVTSNGHGTWNQIEMDDMLGESPRSSMDSEVRSHVRR